MKSNDEGTCITIIMPVYNAETFLEKSVGSIIAQTYENWELILVNDCSKDSSGELCDKYARSDERIRVVHHTKNMGIGESRNDGIAEARGGYVGFVDADDFIHPQMLETYYNAICRDAVDIIICNSTQWPDRKSIETELLQPDSISYDYTTRYETLKRMFGDSKTDWQYLVVWNKLYRADLAKKIIFPKQGAEDAAFNFFAYGKAQDILYVESAPLYYWIQRNTSITHGNGHFTMYHVMSLQTFFELAEEAHNCCNEIFCYAAIKTYKRILNSRYNSKNTLYYEAVMEIIRYNFTQFNKRFMKCKEISVAEKVMMTTFYYIPGVYATFRYWQEEKALYCAKSI